MLHLCDGILNHAGKSNCFAVLHAATYYLKMIVAVHVCQRWFHVVGPSCVLWLILSLYVKLALIQCNASISRAHIIDSHVSYCKKCKKGEKMQSQKSQVLTVHIHAYTSMTLFFRVIQLHHTLSIDPIIKLTTLLFLIFSFHFATHWP